MLLLPTELRHEDRLILRSSLAEVLPAAVSGYPAISFQWDSLRVFLSELHSLEEPGANLCFLRQPIVTNRQPGIGKHPGSFPPTTDTYKTCHHIYNRLLIIFQFSSLLHPVYRILLLAGLILRTVFYILFVSHHSTISRSISTFCL